MDHVEVCVSGRTVRLQLRELNGFDEQSVSDLDTATAISLIDRLLVHSHDSSTEQCTAATLTSSQRDRLLAKVYEATFGPRIESTVRCVHCDELFDIAFDILDLLDSLESSSLSATAKQEPDGTYRLQAGLRFRLPVGQDELAVVALPPGEAERALLERCIIDSKGELDVDAVQEAMEEVAPVMDLELEVKCPECRDVQPVHFDIQFFLLGSLLQERRRTGREIHRLAVTYRWSLQEILGLSRSQRRTFVGFIEDDNSRVGRAFV